MQKRASTFCNVFKLLALTPISGICKLHGHECLLFVHGWRAQVLCSRACPEIQVSSERNFSEISLFQQNKPKHLVAWAHWANVEL
jgi:hypothetical protein